MIARRDTLDQALRDIEARALPEPAVVVVNRRWWDRLSSNEQSAYRARAGRAGVELRVDEAISSHFVEIRGGEEGPPLSTERPM